MGFRYATIIGLLIAGLFPRIQAGGETSHVLASWRGDLDGDKAIETVQITCASVQHGHPMGGEVIISRVGQAKPIWRQIRLNPWKLQVVDVDGDGSKDIVLGVWKTSPKDPVMARRVFIYSWNGRRLMPKWLSSRLSRRFDDFALADVDKDGLAELFALEIMPGGKHRISEYRWRSFGCDWLGCTDDITGASGLRAGPRHIEIISRAGKAKKLDLRTIRYWRREGNEDH